MSQNLAQVLTVGNSAAGQSIADVLTLAAVTVSDGAGFSASGGAIAGNFLTLAATSSPPAAGAPGTLYSDGTTVFVSNGTAWSSLAPRNPQTLANVLLTGNDTGGIPIAVGAATVIQGDGSITPQNASVSLGAGEDGSIVTSGGTQLGSDGQVTASSYALTPGNFEGAEGTSVFDNYGNAFAASIQLTGGDYFDLPSPSTANVLTICNDGRNPGEPPGGGTGCLVCSFADTWKAVWSGLPVTI